MGRKTITDPAATIPGQRVLETLERYPALTIRQLCRVLGYSYEAKLLQKVVKRLEDAKLVGSDNVLPNTIRGFVGGEKVVTREHKQYQAHYLLEQYAIANTLIAFELFAIDPCVELLRLMGEQQLRKTPVQTAIGNAIPDGYVAYELPNKPLDERKAGFAIEVDGGVEKLSDPFQARDWAGKIERLIAMGESDYRDVFPVEALQVAVVVKVKSGSNERRRDQLVAWTEQLLKESDREDWSDYFRFTSADPAQMSPSEFVSGAHWVRMLGNGMVEQVPLVSL